MAVVNCARLGEAPVRFTEQNLLPAQPIEPSSVVKPGMGASGGPITWSFWVKTRTAEADAMLGSFTPFYKVNAVRLAVTNNFVLYRDSSASGIKAFGESFTGNTTAGSATVSGLTSTTDLAIDMLVTGTGIPAGTYIKSITDSTTIELTNNATATGSPSLDFSSQAQALLTTMERAYTSLRSTYGGGEHPYANNNARIVILAYNIQDDYATTGNYVGGYFSPRDLYSNNFTKALFTDPVALQQYSGQIGALGGYSNEMSIVHYDLNPGYSTNAAQVNDIVIHELSHLFTYSRRVITHRLLNHDLWIAEGIAENAPHVTIATANVQQLRLTQLASPSVIDYYQDAPQLTDFLGWASKVIAYLQSNLFFNYLRHRAEMVSGGNATTFMTQLMTQTDQTINGLDTLLQTRIPGENFASLYGDFVITHYLSLLGIPIDATTGLNGGAASQTRFSFSNVQIGNSAATVNGTTIKSKYSNNIPFNFEGPKCADGSVGLKPNSYVYFRHRFDGGDKTTTNAAGATGVVAGELPLKYVINTRSENSMISATPPTTITLRTYDAGQTLPFGSGGFGLALWDNVHVLVYNPNKTGSCRPFDETLISKRNHTKWIGSSSYGTQPSPDFEWQSDTGAAWRNNQDGAYYRPGGIAAFAGGAYPNNFLYITDYNNMSLQRVNLDNGNPLGRLGSTSTSCPTTGTPWSTNSDRFVNNYCAHTFDSPQGVHADGAPPRSGNLTTGDQTVTGLSATGDIYAGVCVNGSNVPIGTQVASIVNATTITLSQNATGTGNISLKFGCVYVADSGNRRIVKYDSEGNFIAWIGYGQTPWVAGDDLWQNATTVQTPLTLYNAGATDNPRMMLLPWSLTSDATYLYIVDYGANRILRRDRATGAFHSYIGNGHPGWTTSTTPQPGNAGSAAGSFRDPRGIVLAGGFLYIADEGNHRIVRVNVTTGASTGWLGDGAATWNSMATVPAGIGQSANKYFRNPSAVASDGTYLYVADRLNNRIVKWRIDGSNCAAPVRSESYCGWLGHGKVSWENQQSAPASDPYAGVSYYPPDYYAQPHGLALVTAAAKGTKRTYLYLTSVFNGRVGRINLDCVDTPSAGSGGVCDPLFDPYTP